MRLVKNVPTLMHLASSLNEPSKQRVATLLGLRLYLDGHFLQREATSLLFRFVLGHHNRGNSSLFNYVEPAMQQYECVPVFLTLFQPETSTCQRRRRNEVVCTCACSFIYLFIYLFSRTRNTKQNGQKKAAAFRIALPHNEKLMNPLFHYGECVSLFVFLAIELNPTPCGDRKMRARIQGRVAKPALSMQDLTNLTPPGGG